MKTSVDGAENEENFDIYYPLIIAPGGYRCIFIFDDKMSKETCRMIVLNAIYFVNVFMKTFQKIAVSAKIATKCCCVMWRSCS